MTIRSALQPFKISALIVFMALSARAQDIPTFSQYYFDPFIINPSFITLSNQPEVNLIHRIQFRNIDNGPTITGLNVQYPVTPRVSLGLTAYNDEAILFNTISGLFTFGYKVYLTREHRINFGISAGILSTNLDIDEVQNLGDPALANIRNNLSMDGQIGVSYAFRSFKIGFSIPRIFENDAITTDEFQDVSFGDLDTKIIHASYDFDIDHQNLKFSPYLTYQFNEGPNDFNFYEGAGVFSYRDLLGIGGFYNEIRGAGLLFRVGWKGIEAGYSYEFSNGDLSDLGASHEFQLKFRFGKKKEPDFAGTDDGLLASEEDSQEPVGGLETEEPYEDEEAQETIDNQASMEKEVKPTGTATTEEEEIEEPKLEETPLTTDAVVGQQQEETQALEETPLKEEEPLSASTTDQEDVYGPDIPENQQYLLIVGSFKVQQNAEKFLEEHKGNYRIQLIYSEKNNIYYVHLPEYSLGEKSLEKLMLMRGTMPFSDAWLLNKDKL